MATLIDQVPTALNGASTTVASSAALTVNTLLFPLRERRSPPPPTVLAMVPAVQAISSTYVSAVSRKVPPFSVKSRLGSGEPPKLCEFTLIAVAPELTVSIPVPPTFPAYQPPPLIRKVPPLTMRPPVIEPTVDNSNVPGPVLVRLVEPANAPLTSNVRPVPTDHSCAAETVTPEEIVRSAAAGSISIPPERVSILFPIDTLPAGSSTTTREIDWLPSREVARLERESPSKMIASFESGTATAFQLLAADQRLLEEPFHIFKSLALCGMRERVTVASSELSDPSLTRKVKRSIPEAPENGV